ncbi:MAG TPA: hypothetical protein VNJ02_04095, partial [Vicinamibacterales bacterium]|nr:hypothetical protein [Vicinamibacterales bacterium]
MRFLKNALVVTLTVSFLAAPVRVQAQAPQALTPGAIERALLERSADVAAQRGAIYAALQQTEVQRVAARLGVDVSRAERAVATLGGVELNQMAAQ